MTDPQFTTNRALRLWAARLIKEATTMAEFADALAAINRAIDAHGWGKTLRKEDNDG